MVAANVASVWDPWLVRQRCNWKQVRHGAAPGEGWTAAPVVASGQGLKTVRQRANLSCMRNGTVPGSA
jgi:hypothetical protein